MGDVLVTSRVDDRIAIVTLDSPSNRNALSRQLVAELRSALALAAADETLHGVVLQSSGRVFCAGADLREAAHVDMTESARGIIAVERDIAALPVPVCVRLEGPVRAGGLGIVAAADIVVCSADVTFALTETRLGLAPAVISIPLAHRVSSRALADWCLTGRVFRAEEAAGQGLVSGVHPPDAMAAAVASVEADLRAGARVGLSATKELLNAPLVAALDDRGEAMARRSGELFHARRQSNNEPPVSRG